MLWNFSSAFIYIFLGVGRWMVQFFFWNTRHMIIYGPERFPAWPILWCYIMIKQPINWSAIYWSSIGIYFFVMEDRNHILPCKNPTLVYWMLKTWSVWTAFKMCAWGRRAFWFTSPDLEYSLTRLHGTFQKSFISLRRHVSVHTHTHRHVCINSAMYV